jgi:hypothetical protein
MPIIEVIITLILVGVILALLNRYGPPYIDGKILTIINIVVVLIVILWLLRLFGVFTHLGAIRTP